MIAAARKDAATGVVVEHVVTVSSVKCVTMLCTRRYCSSVGMASTGKVYGTTHLGDRLVVSLVVHVSVQPGILQQHYGFPQEFDGIEWIRLCTRFPLVSILFKISTVDLQVQTLLIVYVGCG